MPKILINALSGIGDALMFSPALRMLKENIDGAEIDMLVMFGSARDMYRASPHLNKIYFIDFLHQSKRKSLKEIYAIRKLRYDYIINTYPSNRFEYNILSFMLGGKKRIAHHYLHTGFTRFEFLNHELVNEEEDIHNVVQNINLINRIKEMRGEIPGTEIFFSQDKITEGGEWIKANTPQGKCLIGFHAGSSVLKNHIHKRWKKENFIELGKKLIANENAFILLFGNETELNSEIKENLGENAALASTPDYMDSLVRMEHCELFVSNDTAFMHSAAALKIKTAAIFGYTNYKELFPWNTHHRIIRKSLECSPCFFNSPKPATCKRESIEQFTCIESIETEEVYAACTELIKL